jgi:hypothetical protein
MYHAMADAQQKRNGDHFKESDFKEICGEAIIAIDVTAQI